MGGFRIESEVSYRKAKNKELEDLIGVLGQDELGGSASALSVMLNGLIDFGPDDGLQFYAGGGAGIARVKHRVSAEFDGDPEEPVFRGSSKDFAWQGIAGLRFPVGDSVDLGLKYRYFNVPNYSMINRVDGGKYKTDWSSHSLLATLTFNFGGVYYEEITTTSTPPPPPPPPPSTMTCPDGTVVSMNDACPAPPPPPMPEPERG